jgi:hypothetical protein
MAATQGNEKFNELGAAIADAQTALRRLWLAAIDAAEPVAAAVVKEQFAPAVKPVCAELRKVFSPNGVAIFKAAMMAARSKLN